jgi:hypothetical protein
MASKNRQIWTEDEKIPIHIGDDFIEKAFNYLMKGVYNWVAEGKERVALDKLARAQLLFLRKKPTTKNIKDMKAQIKAAAVLVPKDKPPRTFPDSSYSGFPGTDPLTALAPAPKAAPKLVKKDVAPKDTEPAPSYLYGTNLLYTLPELKEMGNVSPHLFSDPKPYPVTDPAIVKDIVNQTLNNPAPSVERKETRQEPAAPPPFDKDKDIFHKIAYGISQLTGQDPSVTYDYPGDPDYNKKKGGKVKKKSKKKTTSKKYSMNRGGIASVRKPTRA